MPKSMDQAVEIARKNFPEGVIQRGAVMGDKYVFVIFDKDESEGQYDPYYYVDKAGKFGEFSIVKDTTPSEVIDAFAKTGKEYNEER